MNDTQGIFLQLGDGSIVGLLVKSQPVPAFQRIPVKSSNIAEVAYSRGDALLRITFHSGEEYEYSEVPFLEFKDLVQAHSVGRHFNEFIKGQYTTKHLEEV